MWMRMEPVVAGLAVMLCSGCGSGISIRRVSQSDPPQSRVGIPYQLPMTQFDITITRRLIACKYKDPKTQNKIDKPQFSIQASIKPTLVADPDNLYVLRSKGLFNTSDIKASYSDYGVVTDLNTKVSNQTGSVVSNIISTAASIATLALGAGGAAGAKQTLICNSNTEKLFHNRNGDDIPKLKLAATKLTESVSDLSKNVNFLSTQIKILAPTNVESLKRKLAKNVEKLAYVTDKLNDKKSKLEKMLSEISDVQVEKWPPNGSVRYGIESKGNNTRNSNTSGPKEDDQKENNHIFDFLKKVGALKNTNNNSTSPLFNFTEISSDAYVKLKPEFYLLSLAEQNQTRNVGCPEKQPQIKNDKSLHRLPLSGIPIRFPKNAMLLICVPKHPKSSTSKSAKKKNTLATKKAGLISSYRGPILQMGTMYWLPVTGGTFRSQNANVQINASGSPTTLETADSVSVAGAVSKATAGATKQLASLPSALRAAKLKRVQDQSALLTAQTDLAKAQATSGNDQLVATLSAEAALVQAEVTLSQAKSALLAAQASQPGL